MNRFILRTHGAMPTLNPRRRTMKKQLAKSIFMALAGIVTVSLTTASALTITSTELDPTGYLAGPGTLLYDFENNTAPSTLTGNYTMFPIPSGTSQSAAPAGDTSKYFLSVPNPSSTGSATFAFSFDMDYLGLYWGSIDTYNKIEFFNNGTLTGTVLGSNVANPANGNQTLGYSNRYVHISDIVFDKFTLTSTQYAFEVDNIAVRAVPEPTTLLLFGAGLAGLAAVGRRRRAN